MILALKFTEIEDYIFSKYGRKLELKAIDHESFELRYIFTLKMKVIKASENIIIFEYSFSWALEKLSIITKFILEKIKRYPEFPVIWDPRKNTFELNLENIPQLQQFLSLYRLDELKFRDTELFIYFHPLFGRIDT